jgi:hypothetical protein
MAQVLGPEAMELHLTRGVHVIFGESTAHARKTCDDRGYDTRNFIFALSPLVHLSKFDSEPKRGAFH